MTFLQKGTRPTDTGVQRAIPEFVCALARPFDFCHHLEVGKHEHSFVAVVVTY